MDTYGPSNAPASVKSLYLRFGNCWIWEEPSGPGARSRFLSGAEGVAWVQWPCGCRGLTLATAARTAGAGCVAEAATEACHSFVRSRGCGKELCPARVTKEALAKQLAEKAGGNLREKKRTTKGSVRGNHNEFNFSGKTTLEEEKGLVQ